MIGYIFGFNVLYPACKYPTGSQITLSDLSADAYSAIPWLDFCQLEENVRFYLHQALASLTLWSYRSGQNRFSVLTGRHVSALSTYKTVALYVCGTYWQTKPHTSENKMLPVRVIITAQGHNNDKCIYIYIHIPAQVSQAAGQHSIDGCAMQRR